MSKELDLSSLSNDKHLESITNDFKLLGNMEELIISNSENFFSYIAEFQKQFAGKFTWSPLAAGPQVWKGVIVKGDRQLTQTATGFMSSDHKRCDALYAHGESVGMSGDWEEAREIVKSFILGMQRHFNMEEKFLFPAFEEKTGMTQGPTQVMRLEHEQMKGVLSQMSVAVKDNDSERVFALGEALLLLMQQHNVKEENMLYPMIDSHVEPEIIANIINQMQLSEVA